LRTIAATTWGEYRQYIEKDPALTRRFQPIHVDEPDVETCCIMLRGLLGPMEKHHGVRISDAAIVAAVNLSHRYIPARQLPDKAVSLLDTAAARVAISQSATPALIEDARVAIAAREAERAALVSDSDLGVDDADRMTSLDADIAALKEKLAGLESEWAKEQALVNDIRSIRKILAEPKQGDEATAKRAELRGKFDELEGIVPEKRMMYAHVDEQSVASVVSDWTGIPVGRMVRDEIETVLKLPEILNRRVVGQSHGLAMIAKRIETSRARLDNPSKPIGVFMLAGPSGVGKTETALALAEALYGGEQNMITINMSEFQEAHTVSSLKGAPPGYVGYGEGGRLTEAVRRKPYSVILLDEVEKAHPDVHEIFFQVFDKGIMEDGNGRRIDFKNTLIILTTNVGTDLIMELSRDPKYRDDPDQLAQRLRPELLEVFPPALLGRLVTIPYFPLSGSMLDGIVRLQLGRIVQRIHDNHGASLVYTDEVVSHIISKCNDPDSGGRMVDNIITNTLLPALSREFLKKSLAKEPITQASVTVENNDFAYEWR
jgi:type VI secretion system protein VasG